MGELPHDRDWDALKGEWGWKRNAPVSLKGSDRDAGPKAAHKRITDQEKALLHFHCKLCKQLAAEPVSTPCSHVFCKACLDTKVGLWEGPNKWYFLSPCHWQWGISHSLASSQPYS